MPRTNTTSRTSFTRPGSVTYDLPDPFSSSTVVTITLPPNSQWTSGLHWHETHTEFLQIISGTAVITLSSTTQTYTSSSGPITVPRYAKHEWRRASPDGPPLVVQEWTEPGDGEKEVFFRNLSSLIEDENRGKEWWLTWQLFTLFWKMDNWPVLLSPSDVPIMGKLTEGLGGKIGFWIEWIITHFVLLVAVLAGRIIGVRGVYGEYTPQRLLLKGMKRE